MRFLYLGKFESPYSTENYVSYALRRLGHEVIQVAHDRYQNVRPLLDYVNISSPDVLLFSKASVPGIPSILRMCKDREILSVCWQWDLYFGMGTRSKTQWAQFDCDLVFTTDGGHKEEFANIGCNHQVLRQGVHYPEALIQPTDYRYKVGFVGHGDSAIQPGRGELIGNLRRLYGDSFIHIVNMRGLKLNRMLSEIEIVVGDSYPSPSYWSNRVYEILGRGGFLLHPETEGFSSEFTSGMHLDTYDRHDMHHLQSMIRYYLRNRELQEAIRLTGHEYCKSNYTYMDRCKTLLAHIGAACH